MTMNDIENGRASNDELSDEIQFDYTKAMPNRFADRLKDQQILVALDPDVAAVFGNAETVNRVLRALLETMPPTPAEAA